MVLVLCGTSKFGSRAQLRKKKAQLRGDTFASDEVRNVTTATENRLLRAVKSFF